ncbi:DNA gyrase inhibitor YacG [Planktotalea sp.]|uniref:DNA gyrase inhibitor YacG n=1 Tax=Planktotalea sp. TaxID=2029877 RepID=UPI003296A05B
MSCPMCENEPDAKYKPFCSKRCADLDLGKWLNGSYALASNDPDDSDALIDAMEQALDGSENDQNKKLH